MFGDRKPYEYLNPDAPQRATPVLGEGWEGHNLLSNHGFLMEGSICPPEYSELKGEAGYIFHWQKKMRCAIRSNLEDISGPSELKLQLHLPTLQFRQRTVLSSAANKKIRLLKTEKQGVKR